MYHSAVYNEPLLKELVGIKKESISPINSIPKNLQKTKIDDIPNLDETQVIRHFHHLSQMNYGVDSGIYPLGSCTMKYNPRLCEQIASWDKFSNTHPFQDYSTAQGNLQIMFELERMLCEITGMDFFCLQPAAGAHGEFLGLLLTRAYHDYNKDYERNEVILPDTSHGTNPASVSMAGYKTIEIPSTNEGTVDLDVLEKTLSNKTACFMLTNPNTLGIFESEILKISKLVHKAGSLLYYDGANMNAIMGKVRPGDMGFDIVHLNLHKTFSTPHGGGGPGSGPVGVNIKLEKFLPIPRIAKTKDCTFVLDYDAPDSIGKIKGFYGNFSVLLKAYVYILMMGYDGLREVSETAVLNSNYMKKKILDKKRYEMPYANLRKHEFVLSCEKLKQIKDVRAMDVAKRLLDYGFHPPTVYFPLIVKEALMIEPTESESKDDLNRYINALIKIADENPETLKNAPNNCPVMRVDDVGATKNPILTWNMV
ncbi:MAG: glycine dehydrogenase (aminomethyl-transferring) [Thermoplasmata archaeon M9B1D]|nr:MAG: glycine dehydrogenase (aminomethyl-transferring) [Thermoplasmata archaeon M9B1D]PNX50750.1 MAG: glycine dehydrogenase (aminomethyl-transferring) [Thermoplasmata archaeon M8B2D]